MRISVSVSMDCRHSCVARLRVFFSSLRCCLSKYIRLVLRDCGESHSSCRGLCFTQCVPRDYRHLHYDQHDLGCKSRNFERRWRLAPAFCSPEEDPVAHLVGLPNFQEDEAMFREARENLRRSPFAEKYMSIVLAMEAGDGSEHSSQSRAFHGVDRPPPRGRDGHFSYAWYCWVASKIVQHTLVFLVALGEIWCCTSPARPRQRVHVCRRC